ncbi:MAG: hypothetical protein HY811_08760 [Planctomycetes bacterium]|nr:hypothetical protein [Planctomycetota bacterium]
MKKMGILALVLALVLATGIWFAGCDKSNEQKVDKMSKEIGKLIADEIKTMPPEAQARFVEHFNKMPPDAKKHLIANLIPGGHGKMQSRSNRQGGFRGRPMNSPDGIGPNAGMGRMMPGQGMRHGCPMHGQEGPQMMKNRQTQGRQMKGQQRQGMKGNNAQAQAKLNQIKNRLMNIPPDKRREAFRKFAQNNPEMARKVKRMLQSQNKPDNNPQIAPPKRGSRQNMPPQRQNKRLQKRPAPETPMERDFWNEEFLNSEGF